MSTVLGDTDRPLSERELQLVSRVFSDPLAFPNGYRAWLKAFIDLETPPCECECELSSGGGTSFVSAMASLAPDLSGWWRMGETIDYSAKTSKSWNWGDGTFVTTGIDNVLADSSTFNRPLSYRQNNAGTTYPQRVANPTFPVDDDGAQRLLNAVSPATIFAWAGATPIAPFCIANTGSGTIIGTLRSGMVWFKTPASGAMTGPIFGSYGPQQIGFGGTYVGWQLRMDAGVLNLLQNDAGVSTVVNLANNTWYCAIWTYDGTTFRLYVNGGLAATSSAPAAVGGGLQIGHGVYKSAFQQLLEVAADLTVDEVALWKRALTAAEVLSLYEAGTTGGNEPLGRVYSADSNGGATWEYPTFESRLNGA